MATRISAKAMQPCLLNDLEPTFPATRYQGSKSRLIDWLWAQLASLDFDTCLDAFGGTGVVAHRLKREGKSVTYNDILRFNYLSALGLIENSHVRLSPDDVDKLFLRHPSIHYPTFVYDTFHDVYFTDDENRWIDQITANIRAIDDPYKFSLAFYALCQSCMIKRPYNLFHRKNLYVRFADVERTFGNKATWDRPFAEWFSIFVTEANKSVFSNGKTNYSYNLDAADVPGDFDLVYIDTPYIPVNGAPINYRDFYHFLEGLSSYDEWPENIDWKSKHLRLTPRPNVWTDKKTVHSAFDRLFRRYADSKLVVSYRSDGIPSPEELVTLLRRYKRNVELVSYGSFKYALSTNAHSTEILAIGI